jgi:methyltransferase (TIGR00027 family)
LSKEGSKTAQGVAWMRAAHMILDGEPKVLDDTIVARFLGDASINALRARADEFRTEGAGRLRAHIILRSRWAEDRLAETVARDGISQFVILGAGGDTFAYRQPEWAKNMRIVEVDHPASQDAKRERLAAAGIDVPANVIYAPIDFETTTLRNGLIASRVDLTVPTFFSWLGVTMYLTEAAIDAVLHTIIGFPSPSEIVFTFAQRVRPTYDGAEGGGLAERAAAVGEPWLSYFDPRELADKLQAFGFSNIKFLLPDEAARYFAGRSDGLLPPRRTSIVSGTV